jgi:hypothetical protein
MISGKLGRIVSRPAITLAFAIGIGAAATLSLAHADGHHGEWHDGHHGEWHDGHWGYWGWRSGVQVFIAEPYPYAYYPPPPPVYYAPPPPPVVYVPPPVVAPSFGVFIGVGHH